MRPPKCGPRANSSLMIYALMCSALATAIEAIDSALPLSLAGFHEFGQPHFQHEPVAELLPGLTGYRNYYGPATTTTTGNDDLATYGNYAHKLLNLNHHHPHTHPHSHSHPHQATSPLGSTANGFVPFYYNSKLHSHSHSQFGEDAPGEEALPRQPGHIDFVINAANYDPNANGYEAEEPPQPNHHHHHQQHQQQQQQQQHQQQHHHENYAYRPLVSFPTSPPNHYHFEQISNYRENRQPQEVQEGQEHEEREEDVYARIKGLQTLANPVKRQQQEESQNIHNNRPQQEHHQPYLQSHQIQNEPQQVKHYLAGHQDTRQRSATVQDQQLQYSKTSTHIADLPPVTTSVHHTPASKKAIAGLPLTKHIEVTKNVPLTHYQKQFVPYKQPIQLQIPKTVIAAIPKPLPIKVPVSKTIAVPQLQEVKIPIERVRPVPVERPIPFVVERRVPYRVEKAVATPVYYPYPVKVPVVRTVVHKQRPHYVAPGWSATGNHLLG